MRHINIPIFIPHLGCPNQCIFCNQKFISGKDSFDEFSIKDTINQVLATKKSEDCCEIAFFGGSFTGIDRDLMIRLLELAQFYVDKGDVCGIRMSTRPDYISREIVDILKKYTVTYVELGVQSMNDKVLAYLKRGHTVQDTENAIRLLNEAGIPFIGQMMIGLPGSSVEDELYTARRICEMGAVATRIYPTVVFKGTRLADMTESGEYSMLTIDEAVSRSKDVLAVFEENGVECIRIGLCASDNLFDSEQVMGGANHPSLGELVMGERCFDIMRSAADEAIGEAFCKDADTLCFRVPNGELSKAVGQRGINRKRLEEIYKPYKIEIKEAKVPKIVSYVEKR